jgi:uncharacterized protein (DUF488 family)
VNSQDSVKFRNRSREKLVSCEFPHTIHTIGHSTRTIGVLIELLKAHDIEMVVDVRRWPASRRLPHFNRESLTTELKTAGIDYVWRGDLGGFRKPAPDSPNSAWRVGAFRAYADFMLTREFQTIITEVEELAATRRIALLCAEAVPWRCHRQLLADAFLAREWTVRHIMDNGCHEHKLPSFAQLEGNRIYYRGLL